MKDALLIVILIMLFYLYQSCYNNEYRIIQLERLNRELKKELSTYKVRMVSWYNQYEGIDIKIITNDITNINISNENSDIVNYNYIEINENNNNNYRAR